MSGSPQLYPEDQHEIFVAIPPPLVPPLARQLSSSHHGIVNPQQLATPTTSTDNSFEQWTSFETLLLQQQHLQQQQQRAMAVLGGDRGSPGTSSAGIAGSSGTGGQNRGLPPVSVRSGSRTTLDSNTSNASNTNTNTTTTNRANSRIGGGGVVPLSTPISSPQQPPLPISLPVQLLNRLYPFSAMSTSVGSGSGSGVHPSVTESSSCASSSSAGSYLSRNFMSGFGGGSGVNISGGFGSRSATSVMQQHQPDMMARRNSTEFARTAAATAIVNTLVSRGNSGGGASGSGSSEAVGLSIPRGDSPYIPSSLSMLFSDPEIMQVQTEVDRHHQQQQQQRQRRTSSSQLTLSHSGSGVGSGIFAHSEGDDQEGAAEEQGLFGEETRLLQDSPSGNEGSHTITTGAATGREGGDGGYGYEVIQEDQQEDVFRPYVAMMARDDYLAPHEPSSSSPLFPSPLTTLGGFASGTSMLDVAEDQQAQAAGRIWRDYGTMMENGGGGGGGVQFQRQQQLQNPTAAQSHAAYYHAVSNYHYSYNSNPHDDARGGSSSSTSQVNPCVPTGHYAVPESWQWRRQRDRGASHQSYGSAGGNGGSGTQRNNGDGSEDNWLWGILVSAGSCWVCCETAAACCTNCCL